PPAGTRQQNMAGIVDQWQIEGLEDHALRSSRGLVTLADHQSNSIRARDPYAAVVAAENAGAGEVAPKQNLTRIIHVINLKGSEVHSGRRAGGLSAAARAERDAVRPAEPQPVPSVGCRGIEGDLSGCGHGNSVLDRDWDYAECRSGRETGGRLG